MRCHHHHLLVSKNGACLVHHGVRRQTSISGLAGSSTSQGLGTWRVLKEEHEGKGGNSTSALLRCFLNPRTRWEMMHSEGRDLGDMLASWQKDVVQFRVAAGADLQQTVQVATVMQHAPAAYRDLLKVVAKGNRETYQASRVHVG